MFKFSERHGKSLDVEAVLRAPRREADETFVAALGERIERSRAPRRLLAARPAFALGLTLAMLAAIGSVGGLSYAGTILEQTAHAVRVAVAPTSRQPLGVVISNAGSDQYRPGYGFGDPNHNHSGPPGVSRPGGAFAPPLRALPAGKNSVVTTKLTIDEQAHLTVSVVGPNGQNLLLTQNGTLVGGKVTGPQTKAIQYLVLVPRTLNLKLLIPANLLVKGQLYKIVIRARDADGNVKTFTIPFRA